MVAGPAAELAVDELVEHGGYFALKTSSPNDYAEEDPFSRDL
jgi:hypothetical protein